LRFYGWVISIFLLFFSLSIGLYLTMGRIESTNYNIEKSPKFTVKNVNYDISFLNDQLNDINDLSIITRNIMDDGVFVGTLNFDFRNNKLTIKPVTKNAYDDFRSLIISTGVRYKESRNEYALYGLTLAYYQLITDNLYLELTPKIYVLNLENFDENTINIMKSRYNLFTQQDYRSYSFNRDILNSLNEYGGVIVDEDLLNNPAVNPLLDVFRQENIDIEPNVSVLVFEG